LALADLLIFKVNVLVLTGFFTRQKRSGFIFEVRTQRGIVALFRSAAQIKSLLEILPNL
jgi:hypothetical protein